MSHSLEQDCFMLLIRREQYNILRNCYSHLDVKILRRKSTIGLSRFVCMKSTHSKWIWTKNSISIQSSARNQFHCKYTFYTHSARSVAGLAQAKQAFFLAYIQKNKIKSDSLITHHTLWVTIRCMIQGREKKSALFEFFDAILFICFALIGRKLKTIFLRLVFPSVLMFLNFWRFPCLILYFKPNAVWFLSDALSFSH